MTLVMDGLLLMASVTACLYCFLLNRRLKNLNNLQGGIGATILQMTSSLSELETSLEEAKKSSAEASGRVSEMIDHGGALAELLYKLVERAEAAKQGLASSDLTAPDHKSSESEGIAKSDDEAAPIQRAAE